MRKPLPPGVRELSPEERAAKAEPAFGAVFASNDPFGTPFQPSVAQKALLYPVNNELEEGQFEALALAAAVIGEAEAYYLNPYVVEDYPISFEFSLGDYTSYAGAMSVCWILEAAVFSRAGTWGLLFSDEHHLVAGGPPEFMEALLERFPATVNPPMTVDISPEVAEARPGRGGPTDIDDLGAYFWEHGKRIEPPVDVAARDQVGSFASEVRRWRDDYGMNPAWLGILLEHLYGQAEAREILVRASLG